MKHIRNFISWSAKKAPYYGILGAAIIFLSWIVTNALSEKLAKTQAALDRASADNYLRSELDIIRSSQREAEAEYSRIEIFMSMQYAASHPLNLPQNVQDDILDTDARVSRAEHSLYLDEGLEDTLIAVETLSGITDLPKDLSSQIQAAVKNAEHDLKEYRTLREAWRQKKRNYLTDFMEVAKSKLNANIEEYLEHIRTETDEYIRAADPLESKFIDENHTLMALRYQTERFLDTRSSKLRRISSKSVTISWILYGFGTLIAIVGKWLEIRTEPRSSQATADQTR